jgi:uncharacterized protein YprB with RNaseH-like and TPR domain
VQSKTKARILHFDIEATALNASFGHTLCIGYRYDHEGTKATKVDTIYDYPADPGEEPDAGLLRRFHGIITDETDIVVTWYGKEYDRKFLNTRMLMAGLPPMPPLSQEHIDLYYTARGNLALHSNRLQGMSEALGCPFTKTPVRADVWRMAMRGDRKALDYVVKHCRIDVNILKWAYDLLRPYVRQHPPVTTASGACRVCGADSWEKRGRRFTMGALHSRARCNGCGAWTYFNAKGKQVTR